MSEDIKFLLNLPRPARKGELKKMEIILAAIDCIAEDGIEATTFESIGKRVNLHKANVAYHFPNKSNIIEAAVLYISHVGRTETAEYMATCKNKKDSLKYFIYANFQWLEKNRKRAAVMMLFYYYCAYNNFYRKLNFDIRKMGQERIYTIITKDLEIKGRAETLRSVSRQIQNQIVGEFIEAYTVDHGRSIDLIKKNSYRSAKLIIQAALHPKN